MSTTDKPAAPSGLGPRGLAFWQAVVDAYSLAADEVEVLIEVCRHLDLLDRLEAALAEGGPVLPSGKLHPAVNALRSARSEARALLAMLGLPQAGGGVVRGGRAQAASRAARSRWGDFGVYRGGDNEGET